MTIPGQQEEDRVLIIYKKKHHLAEPHYDVIMHHAVICIRLTCDAPLVSAQPKCQLIPAALRQRNQEMRGDGEDSG